jgi:hypothetical protein
MNEQTLNQQSDQEQSVFKPSEVISIDYWLLHYNERIPKQPLENTYSSQETRERA